VKGAADAEPFFTFYTHKAIKMLNHSGLPYQYTGNDLLNKSYYI